MVEREREGKGKGLGIGTKKKKIFFYILRISRIKFLNK